MKKIPVGTQKAEHPVLIQGLFRASHLSPEQLLALLDVDLENGITFLDTSDFYDYGYNEELIGKALSLRPGLRDRFTLQTKVGIVKSGIGDYNHYDFSEKHILEGLDASLRRLQTDHVDYYLLHRPDALFEPEEVASAFDRLAASGKVLNFGVSNMNSMMLCYLKQYIKQPIEVNQLQFSVTHTGLLDSSIYTNRAEAHSYDNNLGLIDYCRMTGCTIQAWSPYRASKSEYTGNLIGSFTRTRPFLDSPEFPSVNAKLRQYAKKYGVSPAAVVVAWILRHPAKMQVVLGSTRAERVLDSCKGIDLSLSRDEWYDIYQSAGNPIP